MSGIGIDWKRFGEKFLRQPPALVRIATALETLVTLAKEGAFKPPLSEVCSGCGGLGTRLRDGVPKTCLLCVGQGAHKRKDVTP